MTGPYQEDGEDAVFGSETRAGLPDGVKVKNFEFRARFNDDEYEQKETAFYEELNAFLDEKDWYDINIETQPFGFGAEYRRQKWMVKEAHVFYREEDD